MEGLHVRSEGRHLFITVTAFFYSLRAAFCVYDAPSRGAPDQEPCPLFWCPLFCLCTLCGERLRKRRVAREALDETRKTVRLVPGAREREPRLWGPAGTAHENRRGRTWTALLRQHSRLRQHS